MRGGKIYIFYAISLRMTLAFFFKLMEFFFFSLVNTIHSALCLILLLLLALVYLPVETEHLRSIEILDEIFNLVEDYHLSLYLILCDLFILLCYIKKKNYFGSQKYILKSKIPLTVAVTVILSACHSGGPHRNNGENYQCFSRQNGRESQFQVNQKRTVSKCPDQSGQTLILNLCIFIF